jgi:hypothetical protein
MIKAWRTFASSIGARATLNQKCWLVGINGPAANSGPKS